ncbi:MAG: AAA domain-containing protein, partial [Bacteroidales bacterium]|nr:AAA domain-containing protein [Bacteroidales bacterium]
TFIANEHILSKLGNKTKENSGFASRWHDTLEEKRQAGNIYDRLTLISPNELTEGNVSDVTLQFAEELSSELSDFRLGDTVVLYPYDIDKEPDLRKTMVLRGRIKAIDIDNIVISLNATQSDARIFLHASGAMWAIEHDFMESSDDALYRGMHAFLSAPQERRDLLMLQRAPEFDESKTLNGDYGAFNPLMTAVKQAEDLFLIIGPPGTGKTSYGLLNTLKEELSEEENSVLLLSYTNRAVDEMCSKLIEDGIDFIRLGNRLTCATEHHNYLLESRTKQCKNVKELKEMILSTRVFVATTSTKNSHLALLKLHPFTLTIIDEASQILEPHLIGILSAKNSEVSAIKKIVMIGDHKQLPAVVQQQPSVSRVDDEALNDIHLTDCRLSLFERLLRQYRADSHVVGTLHKQGRMHPEIADFPNQIFYNNELEAVGSPCDHQTITLPSTSTANNGIDQMLETRRITFLHVDAPQSSVSDKVNQAEADIIATIIERIYIKEGSDFDAIKTVGIIVPYRNQIATVRAAIDQKGIPTLHDITIDTVERYQGSQRKYIIYGITIQKKYQLEFLTNNTFTDIDGTTIDRKLNVAMTRAKEHLIMTGNATLLLHNITYKKLLTYLKRHQNYFEIAKENIETGCFNLPETKI